METNWWEEARRQGQEELRGVRVAVYGSGGAPFHHAALAAHFGATPLIRSAGQIRAGNLKDVDVLVFPGGGARAMGGMLEPLGVEGANVVREWVGQGGTYVGSCAGSFLPANVGENYWKAHPEARELHMVPADLANGNDSEWEGLTSPGVGRIRARITRREHWLAHGLPESFELVHYNGPMFRVPAGQEDRGEVVGVAAFDSRTEHFTPSESFMGDPAPEHPLFDRWAQSGTYTAIASGFGQGTVVLFGSHPEFGYDTLQLGWGPGSRLFLNALVQAGHRKQKEQPTGTGSAATDPQPLSSIAEELELAAQELAALAGRDASAWLTTGTSPQFLGLSPEHLWTRGLSEGTRTLDRTAAYLRQLGKAGNPDALAEKADWLHADAPENQDYGFLGLRQLVRRIRENVHRANDFLDVRHAPLRHAYDGLDSHPFQLVVGSYLSAIGLVASAALSSTVVGLSVAPDVPPPTGPSDELTESNVSEVL